MSLLPLPTWLRRSEPAAEIRLLDGSVAPALARIHGRSFAHPWDATEFERLIAERSSVGDGLWLGGELAGFALSRRVVDEAEVLTLGLAPEARGRGWGRRLLARHLDALARLGARVVHLEVDEDNLPALALYRAQGFREVGRRPAYYAKADGTKASALTMSARL